MTAPLQELIHFAMRQHQAGQLAQAAALYREALEREPRNAGVLHLLGLIHYQQKNYPAATETIQQAIQINRHEPLFHFNLGKIYADSGKPEAAIASYRRALVLKPDYAEAHLNLGNALLEQGKADAAIACFRKTIALSPQSAAAHNGLGSACRSLSDFDQAAAHFRQALELRPDHFQALANLGTLLSAAANHAAALPLLERAAALHPASPEMQESLADTLRALNLFELAETHYRRALELRPASPLLYAKLGHALSWMGKASAAVQCYQHVLQSDLEHRLAILSDIANVKIGQGQIAEGIACYQQSLAYDLPHAAATHSNLLLALHYLPHAADHDRIFEQSREWAQRYTADISAMPEPPPRPTSRPLRIGYVSGDFRSHPVSVFLEPVLACHNPAEFEIFCYSNTGFEDDTTRKLRSLVPHWRDIDRLGDADAAAMIRHQDEIDILVDLSGHTGRNRLQMFACKPAPLQATWIGYCNTSGLAAMDYLIADSTAIPPHSRQQFSEQVYRLPGSYLCFAAADYPAIAPRKNGTEIVFGCLNNLPKVNAETIGWWAEILRCTPGSKITIKSRTLLDPPTRERYLEAFLRHGTAAAQVELQGGFIARSTHLAAYGAIDVALDTFPYSGVTTTCEALWMGVPVVTLAGEHFVSRNSAGILHNLGLDDLVANTPEQYVKIAAALAADRARREKLRSELRARFAASTLGDPASFTRNLECAYREMWQKKQPRRS